MTTQMTIAVIGALRVKSVDSAIKQLKLSLFFFFFFLLQKWLHSSFILILAHIEDEYGHAQEAHTI